nr:hypothetical protein [Escherichia coli]
MNLDIELVNCDITSFKGGEESRQQKTGKNVSFDGTEGDANTLKDGDNVLHYTAIVKKSSANNAQVTEGAFSAVATGDAANLLI